MQEKLYPWRWAILIGMTVLLVSLQFSFIVPGGADGLIAENGSVRIEGGTVREP